MYQQFNINNAILVQQNLEVFGYIATNILSPAFSTMCISKTVLHKAECACNCFSYLLTEFSAMSVSLHTCDHFGDGYLACLGARLRCSKSI